MMWKTQVLLRMEYTGDVEDTGITKNGIHG